MAGWQAGRQGGRQAGGRAGRRVGGQAGTQADEIYARLEILIACCRLKHLIFHFVKPMYYVHCFSNFNAFLMLFSGKHN